jgi:asparagine synthase (glutamine-hydrolysing)
VCGISGIYRKPGKEVSYELLKKMTDVLAHRGPDGEGQFVRDNIGFGHRRLSIIDLSDAGKQPMHSADGNITITYNGEIYNFKELRLELERLGHHFRSKTDTEVIIAGYQQWGEDIIPKLNGMFAFGLWDHSKRKLIITRDRFGIKPLYVWIRKDEVVFASEIKAILVHPEYKTTVNPEALNEYFTFQNLFKFHTLFKDIQLLAPARVISFDESLNLSEYAYWDYDFTNRDSSISEKEAIEKTKYLFEQAVNRQLVSDVPVGSYLSGGMDSGSIVGVASRSIPRISTFTCGFDMSATTGREANFDERRDAELMASFFKTEHFEQVINAGDLAWSMPRLIYHLEDLRVGMSYPNYYISRLASRFVKVCLSGAGGDELYGGYPWRYYHVFKSLDSNSFFKDYYSFWQRLVTDEEKKDLFTSNTYNSIKDVNSSFEVFSKVFTYNKKLQYNTPEDHIANSLYFEAKTFLPALFIVGDKLGMASSLEERFPFMDNDLVDFAQKIPIKFKLGNLEQMKRIDENELGKLRKFQSQFDDGKNVLRKAMKEILPTEILNRKKQGFSAPDESWYRGENLAYVKDLLLTKNTISTEFISKKFIEKTIYEHTEKNVNHRLLIWSLLSFEWWCKIFLDGYKVEK